jgi:GGDEF domain-containing protein
MISPPFCCRLWISGCNWYLLYYIMCLIDVPDFGFVETAMTRPSEFGPSTQHWADDAVTIISSLQSRPPAFTSAPDPIPPNLAKLEPMIASMLGAFGMVLIPLLYRDLPQMWVLAAAAALVALSTLLWPARQQLTLLVRCCVLLLVAVPVYLSIHPAAVPPFFLVWILMPAFFYSLLLRPAYAAVAAASALVFYGVTVSSQPGGPDIAVFTARAALLAVTCMLAAYFGQRLRLTDEMLERLRVDKDTGLLNPRGLQYYGEQLMDRSRGKPAPAFSVAVLACDDLSRVHQFYGRSASRKLTRQIADKLAALARSKNGFAASMGHGEFVCVLVRTSAREANELLNQEFGEPFALMVQDSPDDHTTLLPCEVLFAAEQLSPQDHSMMELLHRVDKTVMHLRMHRLAGAPIAESTLAVSEPIEFSEAHDGAKARRQHTPRWKATGAFGNSVPTYPMRDKNQ